MELLEQFTLTIGVLRHRKKIMTPQPRQQRRASDKATDHDLLVRIDEKLINLITSFENQSDKTDAKIEQLVKDKADREEIKEIKQILEDKLPKESFENYFSPVTLMQKDHEARIRQLEKLGLRLGGAWILVQVIFNAWVLLRG